MTARFFKRTLQTKLQSQSNFVRHAFIACLWVTSLLMYLIMLAGIIVIFKGVYEIEVVKEIFCFFGKKEFLPSNQEENEGLIEILHGLELIFVSPLFYLLISFFNKYTSLTQPQVLGPEDIGEVNIILRKKLVDYSLYELTIAKLLSVSLFISILISQSICLILREVMTLSSLFYLVTLILVLIGYYYLLDNLIEKLRKLGDIDSIPNNISGET